MMTSWNTVTVATEGEAGAEVLFLPVAAALLGQRSLVPEVQRAIEARAFAAKAGHWLDLAVGPSQQRVVVVAVDPGAGWTSAGGHVIEAMRALCIESVRVPASSELGSEDVLTQLLMGMILHSFRLERQRQDEAGKPTAEAVLIDPSDSELGARAAASAVPLSRAKAWVEQPANLLTPTVFAEEAAAALNASGATARIFDREELKRLGLVALLAVAGGSHNPPCLFVAEWRGAPERAGWDVALIGKGLTFDGGGLNLKQRPTIEKMKFDMGGGAAVIAATELAAIRGARCNVVTVVPMTENSIGPDSYRPGDVIGSLSGLTIDVQNTDAEGRIVLADAITYARNTYQPATVIDVATLTGAVLSVLHEEFAGLFTPDDELAKDLIEAGERSDERLWRLPISPRQDYLVESPVADVMNVGAPGFLGVGLFSTTAGAKFIERFAKGVRWAHLDIAGTAWATRRAPRAGPGATGFGAALIDEWLRTLEV